LKRTVKFSETMGKKKSKSGGKPKDHGEYKETNESHDGLEMDGADAFEAMQDAKNNLKMGQIKSRHKIPDVSGGVEELYALSGDSDSDDENLPEGVEFDDDDEQTYEEEEDVRAWGNKKKHFYGGNPNDPRNAMTEKDGENELIEAEAEEIEGKLLQKKQLDKLDDEDFFDMFTPNVDKVDTDEISNKVQFDITQLTEKERKALFKKESPEFQAILQDFETKMKDVIEILEPFRKLVDEERIPATGPVVEYVNIKYKLTLTYCVNILTYVMFKTKQVNLKLHPLTKRIVEFKQMLEEMAELDEKMAPKVQHLITSTPEIVPEIKSTKKKSSKKKLKILDKVKEKTSKETIEKDDSHSKNENLTTDERIALEIYEAMRSKKGKQNLEEDSEDENEGLPEPMDQDNGADADDEDLEERRAITYQMSKNKGLQPKRKKEQRNPRVKHRKKFEKAKVRRKGQVREVRTETKRYGGEHSGINMRVKKGIKLS